MTNKRLIKFNNSLKKRNLQSIWFELNKNKIRMINNNEEYSLKNDSKLINLKTNVDPESEKKSVSLNISFFNQEGGEIKNVLNNVVIKTALYTGLF